MKATKKFLSVGLTKEVKEHLDTLKLCKGESYDELIRRTLNIKNESQ